MKRSVKVTVLIDVEIDETKFTPEFMEEYRENFSNYDTLEEHIQQLAYLGVREEPMTNAFLEGYGTMNEMGIKLSEPSYEEIEVLDGAAQ